MSTKSKAPESTKRNNEAWIRDLSHRDSPEQHQAFDELSRLLFKVARRFLTSAGMETLAEECVQEALLIIFRDLEHFQGNSRFTTWAIGIVLHKCREALRERRHESLTDFTLMYEGEELPLLEALETPKASDPELSTARQELVAVVDDIINQELTLRQRTAWVNVKLLDQSTQDVAQQLNTNRNNVYKIVHDARENLKKGLKRNGYTLTDVRRLMD